VAHRRAQEHIMKRAYQDVRWELGPSGAMVGLSLGFDRRAEHVQGIAPLLARMGVNVAQHPIGVHERKVTAEPPSLLYSGQHVAATFVGDDAAAWRALQEALLK
jgi:hypothetical protein